MQGILDNGSLLIIQLDKMLIEIYQVYREEVQSNLVNFKPLQVRIIIL